MEKKKIIRMLIGVVLIILTSIVWVMSAELIQTIFHDQDFTKPFFLTYLSTGLFSVYNLGFLLVPSWRRGLNFRSKKTNVVESEPNKQLVINEDKPEEEESETEVISIKPKEKSKIEAYDVFSTAILLAPLWFFSNFTYNIGLNYTSLTSSSIISNTTTIFGFIFGLLFRTDTFSFLRILCILFSLGGVALLTINDAHEQRDSLWGDLLCIISSVLYALFTAVLKKRVKNEEVFSMPMCLGFIGIINILALFPLFFIFHFTGFELFQLPNWQTWLFLLANGFIGTVVSDLLWSLSVILTNSVLSLMGLSLTIPIAVVVDLITKKQIVGSTREALLYLGGTLLIVLSFFGVNLSYFFPKKMKYYDEARFVVDCTKDCVRQVKINMGEQKYSVIFKNEIDVDQHPESKEDE